MELPKTAPEAPSDHSHLRGALLHCCWEEEEEEKEEEEEEQEEDSHRSTRRRCFASGSRGRTQR